MWIILLFLIGIAALFFVSHLFDSTVKHEKSETVLRSRGYDSLDSVFAKLDGVEKNIANSEAEKATLMDSVDRLEKQIHSLTAQYCLVCAEKAALQKDIARYAFELHNQNFVEDACVSGEEKESIEEAQFDNDGYVRLQNEYDELKKSYDILVEVARKSQSELEAKKRLYESDIHQMEERLHQSKVKYESQLLARITELEIQLDNEKRHNGSRVAEDEDKKYRNLENAYFALLDDNKKCFSQSSRYYSEVLRLEDVKTQNDKKIEDLQKELKEKTVFFVSITSGTQRELYPVAAGMIADVETLFLGTRIKSLDWGNDWKRAKKVESIRELRVWAKNEIEKHKIASYQLQYLLALYPGLQDVLDVDYADLQVEKGKIPEHDYTRDYLSKEEWGSLTVSERNQLALDRYVDSHSKTKWQIGRDYEMYIGYTYETDGWSVQYTGVELGYEDLGRDLIAVRGDETQIVQCKYWSETKVIHEKHIMQLYGTMIAYRVQNPSLDPEKIKGVFVTNIVLSDTAAQFAQLLGIVVREKVPKGEFPRIKCNIGKDEFGSETHIYHLPMDLNYDSVKLDKPGECMVFTVKEAEEKGFRRAFKWSGSE